MAVVLKIRRKRRGGGGGFGGGGDGSWSRFFWYTVFVVLSFVVFSGFFFFHTSHSFSGGKFHPELRFRRRWPAAEVVSGESSLPLAISIREAVKLPDQTLVYLEYPPSSRLFTKEDLLCLFSSADSPQLKHTPYDVEPEELGGQIVRCPASPGGTTVSLAVSRSKADIQIPAGPTHRWNSLVYEALIDEDNTTVLFVKGLNLRPGKASDASRYECVYGWDFTNPKRLLRSEAISVAQEIVRCRTPLSVLSGPRSSNSSSVKVSVRIKGSGMLDSIAHTGRVDPTRKKKKHSVCVCTMVRNGAKFLREWVMYHAEMGVQRWFIYDNNSDDEIVSEIKELSDLNYDISRHVWPWIKTQEAGFAHCAIRAREICEWVGFIDVDEFFYSPSGSNLYDVVRNYSKFDHVGELRASCHSFGPSGLKDVPRLGVTVGYTCRLATPERHKSIVRPEALSPTLINVVHHFRLKDGFEFADVDRGIMVINHYKYQVWEVFKEKFYRRVATYVADWWEEENVGSKDRAPGLGTRPVEPPDWSSRFCEVKDNGLRDRVLESFTDPKTHRLPWQLGNEEIVEEEN